MILLGRAHGGSQLIGINYLKRCGFQTDNSIKEISSLLDRVVDGHGRVERWRKTGATKLDVRLSVSSFVSRQGSPGRLARCSHTDR